MKRNVYITFHFFNSVFLICFIMLFAGCAVVDRYTVNIGDRQFTPPSLSNEQIVEYLSKRRPHERAYIIVQLERTPTLREQRELQDLGIQLITSLPGHAWLASVPTGLSAAQLKNVPVRWVGSLQASDKLAPSIREKRAGPHALREPGRIELLVKLFDGVNMKQLRTTLTLLGGEIRQDASDKLGVMVVSIPKISLPVLAYLPAIRYIEPNLPPGKPEADRARTLIVSDPVVAAGTNGSGSIVGVFEYGACA